MQDAVDVRFSKNELNSLAKTKDTCVTLEKKTRVVFLLPSQLSDIKSGIRENLDSNLLKYDYETKAILIGYEKIKILSKYGSICYGYSKIALRIEACFYLFKPAVGRILQGVVCKQSGRHLGCLVHKGFNVSIPLEDGGACGWDFSIGQDVKFTVIQMDFISGPLPYIRGQLYVDDVDCGAVAKGIGREASEDGRDLPMTAGDGDGDENSTPEGSSGDALPLEDHWKGGGSREVRVKWHVPEESGVGSPPRETGGRGDGRDSLINQLLKTVEMSIAEGEVGSPKKSKQKRVSLDPQSLNRKGPRALSDVLPLSPPPSGKVVEHLPVNVIPPPSGGKGGQKRGSVAKKGGGAGQGGGNDSGSIIDRLLEMSRRELMGVEAAVETPRGKKRKAEGGGVWSGDEGPKRKLSKKVEGSCVTSNMARLPAKRESDLQPKREPSDKQHLLTIDPSSGVMWSSMPVPSEKSVPSKTHKLSQSKMGHGESISGIDESHLQLSTPEISEPTKSLSSRVKRKSLTVKSETYKHEK